MPSGHVTNIILKYFHLLVPKSLQIWSNEKNDNKQCLLDTPHRRQSIIKDSYQNAKVREKICIYKSHGIIKSYKGK